MNPVTIILVFVVIWWLVFFAALPFGVKSQHEADDLAEDTVAGTDPGAPVNPNLWKKALVTSLIAIVLTAIYYYVVTSGMINLRELAPKPLE